MVGQLYNATWTCRLHFLRFISSESHESEVRTYTDLCWANHLLLLSGVSEDHLQDAKKYNGIFQKVR